MSVRCLLALYLLHCAAAQRSRYGVQQQQQLQTYQQRANADAIQQQPLTYQQQRAYFNDLHQQDLQTYRQQRPYFRGLQHQRGYYGNPLGATDILEQVSDVHPDGSFYTKWETANGISYEEQGQPANPGVGQDEAQRVQGSASWTTDDGERVNLAWQADENGAVFQGDHVPTVPPLIQRALDWLANDPESRYYDDSDDGRYRNVLGPRYRDFDPARYRDFDPTRYRDFDAARFRDGDTFARLVPRRPPPKI